MTTETKIENTAASYADLLKARGDVPVTVLRHVHSQLGALLALIDTMDVDFEIEPAPSEAEQAIAAALRAKYPDFKDKTDAEVLDYFGVQIGEKK